MKENLLVSLINASGLRHNAIAQMVGLKESAFSRKVHGSRPFRTGEVRKLAEALRVDERIVRRSLPVPVRE